MKLMIRCECGNTMEVSPETIGQIANFERALREHDFDLDEVRIDVELDGDSVSDADDVYTKLKEIRIDCRRCGRFMVLDCDC